jgi:hypothetical protein
LEAAGVKTKTRGARIYLDDICHDTLTIVIDFAGNIAAKPHSRHGSNLSRQTMIWRQCEPQISRLSRGTEPGPTADSAVVGFPIPLIDLKQ